MSHRFRLLTKIRSKQSGVRGFEEGKAKKCGNNRMILDKSALTVGKTKTCVWFDNVKTTGELLGLAGFLRAR